MTISTSNLKFLVKRRGQPATLIKATDSVYDPIEGTYTSGSSSANIRAYFGQSMLGETAGRDISVGSRWVLISGSEDVVPIVGDVISGVDDDIVIDRIQKIYDREAVVCYLCWSEE